MRTVIRLITFNSISSFQQQKDKIHDPLLPFSYFLPSFLAGFLYWWFIYVQSSFTTKCMRSTNGSLGLFVWLAFYSGNIYKIAEQIILESCWLQLFLLKNRWRRRRWCVHVILMKTRVYMVNMAMHREFMHALGKISSTGKWISRSHLIIVVNASLLN